jgi:WD40 repeat protein
MARSPDGRHLAALGYLGMVHVFDTRDGTEAARFPAGAAARALAFSPDGRQLAVGGRTLRRYPLHALDGDPAALRRASEQRWGAAEGSLGP